MKVKHALRSSGQRYQFQQTLFDSNRVTLFLEPMPEPSEGKLTRGLIVYDGGACVGNVSMDSKVFETYKAEIGAS